MVNRPTYEKAPEYDAPAYRVKGAGGVAWWVLGWETEPDEETEWTGYNVRTGKLVCCMVGDDRKVALDPDDLTPLTEEEFCGGCGQIGCGC